MSSESESRVYLEFVGGSAARLCSAILDTWEDRFDAYLVGLGFDTVTLIVGRPPADLGAANEIAAEHLAFCPDNIFQGVGTIQEYAPMLVDAHRWDFWWD